MRCAAMAVMRAAGGEVQSGFRHRNPESQGAAGPWRVGGSPTGGMALPWVLTPALWEALGKQTHLPFTSGGSFHGFSSRS